MDRPPDASSLLELLPYYCCGLLVTCLLGVIQFDLFLLVILPTSLIVTTAFIPRDEPWPDSAWRYFVGLGLAFQFATDGALFGLALLMAAPAYLAHCRVTRLEKYLGSQVAKQLLKEAQESNST